VNRRSSIKNEYLNNRSASQRENSRDDVMCVDYSEGKSVAKTTQDN